MELSGTLRRTAAIAILAGSGVVASFATIAPRNEAASVPPTKMIVEALALQAREVPAAGQYVQEEQFQRGDTLAGFLGRLGLEESAIARLARAPALRALRPGSLVPADVLADGTPKALSFLTGRDTLVRIVPQGEGFRALEEQASLETRVTMKASVIRSSLFAATDAVGIPDSVAMQLADVFGGDIDFHRDLRKGDRFTVVYELHHLGGRPVRAGRLLAAEFVNQGKTLRAVHYGTGYYAPDGATPSALSGRPAGPPARTCTTNSALPARRATRCRWRCRRRCRCRRASSARSARKPSRWSRGSSCWRTPIWRCSISENPRA